MFESMGPRRWRQRQRQRRVAGRLPDAYYYLGSCVLAVICLVCSMQVDLKHGKPLIRIIEAGAYHAQACI